jgi:hypothetical protein
VSDEAAQADADEGIDVPAEPLDEDEGTVDEPVEDVTDDGDEPEMEGDS